MKPKRGLAQVDFAAPWPIAAVIVMLIGVRWAIAQESIDFQDRNKSIDAGVLSVINTERTARGLGAVSGNEVLQTAAQWMAEDMAARHVLDHTDSRHRGLANRLQDFGYENPRFLAENIAEGQETATAVVNSWLHSPPHRANLLHPEARQAGVGHAVNAQGQHYWVVDLGTSFTNP
jgi:uncharacterized protein YkwD